MKKLIFSCVVFLILSPFVGIAPALPPTAPASNLSADEILTARWKWFEPAHPSEPARTLAAATAGRPLPPDLMPRSLEQLLTGRWTALEAKSKGGDSLGAQLDIVWSGGQPAVVILADNGDSITGGIADLGRKDPKKANPTLDTRKYLRLIPVGSKDLSYDQEKLTIHWKEGSILEYECFYTLGMDKGGRATGVYKRVITDSMGSDDIGKQSSGMLRLVQRETYPFKSWMAILVHRRKFDEVVALLGPPELASANGKTVGWEDRVEIKDPDKKEMIKLGRLTLVLGVSPSGPDKGKKIVLSVLDPENYSETKMETYLQENPKNFFTLPPIVE